MGRSTFADVIEAAKLASEEKARKYQENKVKRLQELLALNDELSPKRERVQWLQWAPYLAENYGKLTNYQMARHISNKIGRRVEAKQIASALKNYDISRRIK